MPALDALFAGLAADPSDGWAGMAIAALAGAATALAVAIAFIVYFRTGYRSNRDIVRHGVATLAVLALLAFVISDMRNAALAYLGVIPSRPAVEFEMQRPGEVATCIAPAFA